MNIYNEIFTTKGIATIFEENYQTAYNDIFGENTAAIVDRYTAAMFGKKWLMPSVTAENCDEIVSGVILVHLQAWQALYATLNANYHLTDSVNETKTKRGTISHENLQTAAQKAFNDANFVDDTQNTANGTETYNVTETRTENNGNAIINAEKAVTLFKANNLQLQVIIEIINEITLNVY